jgi:hypothetical protein
MLRNYTVLWATLTVLSACSEIDPGPTTGVPPTGGDAPTQPDSSPPADSPLPADIQDQETAGDGMSSDVEAETLSDSEEPDSSLEETSDTNLEDTSAEDEAEEPDLQEPDLGPPDTGVDTTPPPPKPLWLLSIDNAAKMLQVVNVETGKASDLCPLNAMDAYPSLTFSRLNGLYASRGGYTLDRIDPCTCEIKAIGGFGGPTGVYGITADPGDSLFGVATTQDTAINIEVSLGMATTLGPLGVNFTTSGATWSQDDKKIYAINGGDDNLYTIDLKTGVATMLTKLNYNFGSVGIEVHPANNKIYACSTSGDLLEVNPASGDVTVIGSMEQSGSCTNLAAPWLEVDCIDVP